VTRPWVDCYPSELTNGRLIALASMPFNGTQLRILLVIIAETLGTPDRKYFNSTDGGVFGSDETCLYAGQIAKACGMHVETVRQNLRRLRDAGVITYSLSPFGGPRTICLELDDSLWEPSRLGGRSCWMPSQ
jgi:hypothetical protein